MALTEVFARFTTEVDDRPLKDGKASADGFADSLRGIGALLAGGALIGGAARFTQHMSALLTETSLTAQRLGLSTAAVQEFGFVAAHAGQDVEELVDAFSTLQERARDAVIDPASDPAEQLRLLGVAARDANGELKSGEQLFTEVADGIQNLGTQTDRVGAVMTLFGDVGRQLLPVLQDGSAGIEDMRQAYRDLGGGASKETIEAAVRVRDSMLRFNTVVENVGINIAASLMPAFERVADWLTGAISKWRTATEGVDFFRLGMVALVPVLLAGSRAALMFVRSLLLNPVTGFVAVIAGLVLIVDDLINTYDTGQGAIRDFLLEHFDYDILTFVDAVADAWTFVGTEIGLLPNILQSMLQSALETLGNLEAAARDTAGSILDAFESVPGLGALIDGAGDFIRSGSGDARASASAAAGAQSRLAAARSAARTGALNETANRAAARNARRDEIATQMLFASGGREGGRDSSFTGPIPQANITINGAGDPEASGRAVRRELERFARQAQADAVGE